MLPAWKVLASDEASLIQVASSSGMAVLPFQPTEVAAWAAACDDVRAQIESGAVESIGALEHQPQRFHSGSGCFKEASSLSPQSACDLFRMDDRDIIGGRVYWLLKRRAGYATASSETHVGECGSHYVPSANS
jgi:hypothetical protein